MSSFAPSKRLGQHFLTDRNILGRIADALDAAPGDDVLEIGAGEGTLTEQLLARGLRVVAIEKDRRLVEGLGARGSGFGNVRIVHGDALHLDWHSLLPSSEPRAPNPAFKIIGNIPYAITSPLIEKALTPPLPERIVFLVQAEVAARLAAEPGTKAYGALTVGVQAVCTVERLFAVKPGAFHPPPKVDSTVVRLSPRPEPLVPPALVADLRAFTTACFSSRRKQLRNAVARATGRPAAAVGAALSGLGLDPATRPERLTPQDFVRLLLWSREL
ncbi:MAG TPA: 16S rRNA (adenine(1518)-N(6)/adenine(1519)-N(6))-dimethyltransferase RsmA [Gemmatimonadales bacterium]